MVDARPLRLGDRSVSTGLAESYREQVGQYRKNKPGWLAVLRLAGSAVGCRPVTNNPMLAVPAPCVRASPGVNPLVVLLPARGDRADRAADFDMIAADAHFGHYRDRSLDERGHTDVLVPAHGRGYDAI